jgi:hypothetical protein
LRVMNVTSVVRLAACAAGTNPTVRAAAARAAAASLRERLGTSILSLESRSGTLTDAFATAAGTSLGALLGAIAGLRRGKAVHPHGCAYSARLVLDGTGPSASELLGRRGDHHAVVRFSRSLGVPRPIPDLLGMSIRVPDAYGPGAHQDLLLVTSADIPVVHHLFLPAGDVQQRPYTSSLPYRAGDERFLVGALPDPASPRPSGSDELDRLRRAAETGRLRFKLGLAPLLGRFRPVGEIWIESLLPPELDALRFNPWNTGGGLVPAGWLNGARDRAYKMSQAAWGRTQPHGAELQQAADHRLTAARSRG